MPGKILLKIISLCISLRLNYLATLTVAFFVCTVGQFLGGLGIAAAPEAVLAGVPPLVA